MTEISLATITIGKSSIPYQLVRTDAAQKLILSMTMDAFRVTAPSQATELDVQQGLLQKQKWIIENYATLQEKYEQTHKIARFRTGAKLPYWGRLIRLKTQIADVQHPEVSYSNGFLVKHPNFETDAEHDNAIEEALQVYLKQRFTVEAKTVIKKYSDLLGMTPSSIRVTEMSNRWGSCSVAGTISLDWRLVFAPKRVVSYVIAHELAHLKINNHTNKFWSLLASVYGDYQHEHSWLQKNEHMLGYKKLTSVLQAAQT